MRELKQWSEQEASSAPAPSSALVPSNGGGGGGRGWRGDALRDAGGAPAEALPAGGEATADPTTGRLYYYHTQTRAVQWARPRPDTAPAAAAPAPPPPPALPPPSEEAEAEATALVPVGSARGGEAAGAASATPPAVYLQLVPAEPSHSLGPFAEP